MIQYSFSNIFHAPPLPNKKFQNGVNPIVAASTESKIIIVGQAPGRIVHNTNIPWNDKSGDNLRSWLAVDKETFYNTNLFAVIPMGFCCPGTGKNGNLPPRSASIVSSTVPLPVQLSFLLAGVFVTD